MKFDKYYPCERLKPYVRYFVLSEQDAEHTYKVFPSAGLVIGFQYKGQLKTIQADGIHNLSPAGITGVADRYRTFRNTANTGTVLVYFTETGFAHFASLPAHELFNLSVSLDHIFNKNRVSEVEEKLSFAVTDRQRVDITEQFLGDQLKDIQTDNLIREAVKIIYRHKGAIRIKTLNERLFISQSPFEKRFRKIVGTTPKKFASIVRFNNVVEHLNAAASFQDLCYENGFFDPAHFSKTFSRFTGTSPENFKRFF